MKSKVFKSRNGQWFAMRIREGCFVRFGYFRTWHGAIDFVLGL